MYIGKLELRDESKDKLIVVPLYFKKPTYNEVNNILRKYNFPKMKLDHYKILFDPDRRIFLTENATLYSVTFIRSGYKY